MSSNQSKMITFNLNDEKYRCLYSGIKSEYLPYIDIKRVTSEPTDYYILAYKKNFILDWFHVNPDDPFPHDKYNFNIKKDEGWFSSVVASNGNILSYSPPKSYGFELFKQMYENMYENTEKASKDLDVLYVEQFIEGTMINIFYQNYDQLYDNQYGKKGKWIIHTKSNICADYTYKNVDVDDNYDDDDDKKKYTIEELFLDACVKNGFELNDFHKKKNYTFVLQHPRNKSISSISFPRLYLIDVYQIQKNKITVLNKQNELHILTNKHIALNVKLPRTANINVDRLDKFDEKYYYNKWCNLDTDIIMGVVIKHKDNYYRTKFRNPEYEKLMSESLL